MGSGPEEAAVSNQEFLRGYDNNLFAVLGDHDEDIVQDGGLHDMFISVAGNDDGFIPVRGNQSKRQRISSGGAEWSS